MRLSCRMSCCKRAMVGGEQQSEAESSPLGGACSLDSVAQGGTEGKGTGRAGLPKVLNVQCRRKQQNLDILIAKISFQGGRPGYCRLYHTLPS